MVAVKSTKETEARFFDDFQRRTVEAAMARIIPTDHEPGASEAGAIDFLDRYLAGIDFIYAKPDGSGFVRLEGKRAEAWRQRIETVRRKYLEGIEELNQRSRAEFGADFVDLAADQQDLILDDDGAAGPRRGARSRGRASGRRVCAARARPAADRRPRSISTSSRCWCCTRGRVSSPTPSTAEIATIAGGTSSASRDQSSHGRGARRALLAPSPTSRRQPRRHGKVRRGGDARSTAQTRRGRCLHHWRRAPPARPRRRC